MNKEQFIARLEEINAKRCADNVYAFKYDVKKGIDIYVYEDRFIAQEFSINCDSEQQYYEFNKPYLHSFDELEQFLIDKGIVEPKFDAGKYLLSKGLIHDRHAYYYHNPKFIICFSATTLSVTIDGKDHINGIRRDSALYFTSVTKESCDKAIGLINYLESIK